MPKEVTTYAVVGLVLIVLGVLTWKKQLLNLLHSYHHKNVKEEDIPAYARLMGIVQIVIGAGFLLSALLKLRIDGTASQIPLIAGIVAGISVFMKAQKTYNGTWY